MSDSNSTGVSSSTNDNTNNNITGVVAGNNTIAPEDCGDEYAPPADNIDDDDDDDDDDDVANGTSVVTPTANYPAMYGTSFSKMVADYHSKLLQGILFEDHRKTIMGVQPEYFIWYKIMYVKVLKHYELYVDEDDMFDI